jgi:hypothetical protein
MAEIFISYKRERRNAASHLAKILKCYGYTVWYDYSLVKGEDFADQIDAKIKEAKAAVVLWCSRSVRSKWVSDEAALAAHLGILVPAKIEPCELRVDFRSKDYVDLIHWTGSPRDHALDTLLDAIKQKVGRINLQPDYEALREYEEDWRRFDAPSLKAFALGASVEDRDEPRPSPQASTDKHATPPNAERERWLSIRADLDPNVFEDFFAKYPHGSFAAQAAQQATKCIVECNDTQPLVRLLNNFPKSPRREQAEERLLFLLAQKTTYHTEKLKSEELPRWPWTEATGLALATFALGILVLLGLSVPWRELLNDAGFGITVLVLLSFLTLLSVYLPQTYKISEYLTLAERDLNECLRENLQTPPVFRQFDILIAMLKDAHPSVQEELARLRQIMAEPSGKARMTAFLLRELYEGNVGNAQLKIFNEVVNGGKPYIAPGIRQIVGYDRFDDKDVKNNGFPPGAGVGWFPLWLTVKLNRYPRHIIMVRADKTVAENWAVINELNQQLKPAAI